MTQNDLEDAFDVFAEFADTSIPFDEQERDRRHKSRMRGMTMLMESEDGRALLREVLDWSGAFKTAYSANSGAMYYMQGQRSVGFYLLELMQQQSNANLATIMRQEGE